MINEIAGLHARLGLVDELDSRVLASMAEIPREAYISPEAEAEAYINSPIAIGHGQTISQPFIVALMTSLARVFPAAKVLEIGTGSGYQTAVLASLCHHVYSVEKIPELAGRAIRSLRAQGVANVSVCIGDGREGWAKHAPFDAIVVTAAPPEVPAALLGQLGDGARLVIPVGTHNQVLTVLDKSAGIGVESRDVLPVRFVPLV